MEDYQHLWNEVKASLQKSLAAQTFEQTFSEVKYVKKVENGIVYVLVPSTLIKQKINSVYYRGIQTTAENIAKKKITLKFVCDEIGRASCRERV